MHESKMLQLCLYSYHLNTPINQLEHAYYLGYFTNYNIHYFDMQTFKDIRAQKFPRTDFFKTLTIGRK